MEKQNFEYVQKFRPQENNPWIVETCYDFLAQGFLKDTQLDHSNMRATPGIRAVKPSEALKVYFSHVDQFFKVVRGIEMVWGNVGTIGVVKVF